jgi:hypothetical protein
MVDLSGVDWFEQNLLISGEIFFRDIYMYRATSSNRFPYRRAPVVAGYLFCAG